ncbi:hypothetical protein Ddc_11502 [Ditylenchus destructor]|nr:hypothetical protein Ddc_11502 [Ditylenchus destructor]
MDRILDGYLFPEKEVAIALLEEHIEQSRVGYRITVIWIESMVGQKSLLSINWTRAKYNPVILPVFGQDCHDFDGCGHTQVRDVKA